MDLALLAFEGMTALDAVGPYEVLSRVPGLRVRFVGVSRGQVSTDTGMLRLCVDHALSEAGSPDIILVPGGPAYVRVMRDEQVLEWLRAAHQTSRFTTSVCTGSLILGAAGILQGLRAATHWEAMDELAPLGAIPDDGRVVVEGKVITSAGVSAGIDLGLHLAGLIAGQETASAVRRLIQYEG